MPETEKKTRYTDAQKRSAEKYLKQFDDVKIRVPNGKREVMKGYATAHGWNSLNECVVNLLEYVMENNLSAADFKLN